MATGSFKGFGSLKTQNDLLRKIQHDFARLQAAPTDVYAAFDFYVSAYHMLDWLHPKDDAGRRAEEAKSPLLQVCSHLANGAKHFEVTAKQHVSVNDVVTEEGKFFGGQFFGGPFFGSLHIELDGQAAKDFGAKVEAIEFAKQVLAYWANDSRLSGS